MAKHKKIAGVATEKDTTKKLKQVAKKSKAPKAPKAPKTPKTKGNSTGAKNVTKSSKPRGRASKKVTEPVKEEPEDMSDPREDVGVTFPECTTPNDKMKEEKEVEKGEEDGESEESDEDEWEEVEELAGPLGPVDTELEPAVPSQPVEIEIETAEAMHKRQRKEKRKAEFETYLRRMMKRFNKELLEDTHKVHLLCLLAGGLFRNHLCCEPDLLAIALSLLPAHFTSVVTERINTGFLEGLLKWFRATFTLNPELPEEKGVELRGVLERRLGSLSARDHEEMTYLFLLMLRSLQLFCRLVLSLQPVPFKQPTKKNKTQSSTSPAAKDSSDEPDEKPEKPKVSPGSKRSFGANTGTKRQKGGKRQKKNESEEEDKEKEAAGGQRPKNTKRRSVASKVSYKEESSEEEEASGGEEFQLTSEEESDDSEDGGKRSKRSSKTKGKDKGKARRRSSGVKKGAKKEEEEDDDFEEEEHEETKRRGRRRQGKGDDEWIEVYLEGAKRWVCVDVNQGVGKPQLCTKQATQPITYVVGVDSEGYLKDLSTRYDPTWLTSSRRRRIDSEWWEETLDFYECPDSEREQQEDKELRDKLLDKPLPTSISEYKNHPLYALERHLLKYEALYPRTAAILGYCRGEAVYSRDCVHTLHSRDTWLKEARTVRLGEEPYKMVKGFSNRSRKARMMSEQKDYKDLALFGHWQTEEYQPPLAIDGRVPRNEFGNVYMFKPCMLPVGCVHLRLPNLHRVARKLNLDCAAAVTGFDYHGGYAHAVTDGYIVCEEHQEILKAGWENEQEIQQKKEQEKREKRALSNWTLLVKGLLIKERLQRRYGRQGLEKGTGLGQGDEVGAGLSSGEEDEGGAHTAPPTLAASWPQNRQEEQEEGGAKKSISKRERRGQDKHLFPFEKSK
ncbi:DNA repair protein complementing XP-C cells isoform X2 [Colossoma macropomum]|uniref:DNA repair protein complementing XP-C cells isoform X2 n=1 Tax=Colossoma macropomum TaxID=42526 RepID=UPI001864F3C2|nr:DNA repair protein complementing XP-C cells isoform X2 [Colossoma macropomum]